MSELEKIQRPEKKQEEIPVVDPVDATATELPPAEPGLRERVRRLLASAPQGARGTKQELAKDRTRSLALLIGGTVGALLLFIGVFSTPTTAPTQETSGRAAPNLGRRTAPNQPTTSVGSVTPLLNADVRSDDVSSDQLTSADIRGTSQRASADEASIPSETTKIDTRIPPRTPQARSFDGTSSPSSVGSDPLAAYRLNNNSGAPAYSYGGVPPAAAGAERPPTYSYGGSVRAESRPDPTTPVKSSIIFVRTIGSPEAAAITPSTTTSPAFQEMSLLAPGTRLVARLESAATTAVKTPVVASIEYNYERDGIIVVPAGTKAIGEIQQASSEGFLSVRFHTLELPNGGEEKIEGTAVALDHKPLKGEVSGKNTGKKFLSRTLSGAGTIAAYVVGAGGAGLTRPITGETLLRDRLASNVALAGEQEMMNAAYSQNISVTVPANTRFYLVLQKAAVSTSPPAPARIAKPADKPLEIPTAQELRELMDLRREINRMYQESNGAPSGGTKP